MYLAKNKKLLSSFKAGDRSAMEEVYRHYFPGLTTFLRRGFTFSGRRGSFYFKGFQDPSELKSTVQEVFRRAFEAKARKAYDGVNSFSNWIIAIARNFIINQFRNREIAFSHYMSPNDERSHLSMMDDAVTEEFTGLLYGMPSDAQDTALEHSEVQDLVARFMRGLSEHDQRLLVLRFAEGLGQSETAEALKSSRMKVRTIESHLRTRMRAFLKNTGYIDDLPLGKEQKKVVLKKTKKAKN